MIAAVCKSWGAFHYIDYLVMSREKTPSIYTRQTIVKALKEKVKMTNEEIKGLTKSTPHECWGNDQYL